MKADLPRIMVLELTLAGKMTWITFSIHCKMITFDMTYSLYLYIHYYTLTNSGGAASFRPAIKSMIHMT